MKAQQARFLIKISLKVAEIKIFESGQITNISLKFL